MWQDILGFAKQLDVFWFSQIAVSAAAWAVIGQDFPLRKRGYLRILLNFFALFLLFNIVSLGGVGLSKLFRGATGIYPLLRVTGQSLVTAAYMRWFAAGRGRTRLILWLALTTVDISLTQMGGQASMLVGQYVAQGAAEGVVRVLAELLTVVAALFLRRFRFDEFPLIPTSSFGMLGCNTVCVLAVCIYESILPFDRAEGMTQLFLLAYTGMLVMMLATVQALYTLCRQQKEVSELQAEKQRFLSEKEQSRVARGMLESLRAIRHDMKNQYSYMQILLSEKKYEELERYFASLQESVPSQTNLVDCGNSTLNTVLNMEFSKLQSDQIKLEHQLIVPPVLPFRDDELCAILSNLLDNARDECRRLLKAGRESVWVRLEIYPHQSYLYIRCLNSTDRTSIERKRRGLRTTKGDTEIHGYGTQIIGRLAEKYNGLADYEIRDGAFTARVMLDMAAGENDRKKPVPDLQTRKKDAD